MEVLRSTRFELVPVTLAIVEAVMHERVWELEALVGAKMPAPWPGRMLIERAFSSSLEAIRRDPESRLWGDRLIVVPADAHEPRRVAGSVIFHGRPDAQGVVEVGYGIERHSQGLGVASEATRCQVDWALRQPDVKLARASTPPWHKASIRVLEKCGFVFARHDDHEALGEVVVYERPRQP